MSGVTMAFQAEIEAEDSTLFQEYYDFMVLIDSMNNSLNYETGEISIGDDLAVLRMPENFNYLKPCRRQTK